MTNTSPQPTTNSALRVLLSLSSFAPGFGSSPDGMTVVGAEVANVNTLAGQYASASFASAVSATAGPAVRIAGDGQSCSVAADGSTPGASVTLFCGVTSPNQNDYIVPVGPLNAGQTVAYDFTIRMNGHVEVPEPMTMGLFGLGVTGLLVARRHIRRRGVPLPPVGRRWRRPLHRAGRVQLCRFCSVRRSFPMSVPTREWCGRDGT